MISTVPANILDVMSKELTVLIEIFKRNVVAKYPDDQRLSVFADLILVHKLEIANLTGQIPINDDDGDTWVETRARKSMELLHLIPQTPKPKRGEDLPDKGGLPLTRAVLWNSIIQASVRGCGNDAEFANFILKKIRLTGEEQKSLRQCLRVTLSNCLMFEPRLIHILKYVTRRSNPIVVRAFMHAAASRRVPDDILLEFFVR